jgi:hypothetical protein
MYFDLNGHQQVSLFFVVGNCSAYLVLLAPGPAQPHACSAVSETRESILQFLSLKRNARCICYVVLFSHLTLKF